MSKQGTFHVGDSDLVFLGLATSLAARWHLKRKGGRMRHFPVSGFPQSDQHAVELVKQGMLLAEDIPLDDVNEIWISVDADSEYINRLLATAKGLDKSE